MFRQRDTGLVRPAADGLFTDVVSGTAILFARITEPDNQPTRLTTRGGGFAASKEQGLLLGGFFSRGFCATLGCTLFSALFARRLFSGRHTGQNNRQNQGFGVAHEG